MDKVTDRALSAIIDDPTGVNSKTVQAIATEPRTFRIPADPGAALPYIGWSFLVDDEINGGPSPHWSANPPTDPSAREVVRVMEFEFDRVKIERAEYRAKLDAQDDYENGSV